VQTDAWRKTTGKPYGFYGITVTLAGEAASAKLDERARSLFNGSKFLYTRETASLANLKTAKIDGPKMGLAPDSTFSFDIRDDATGDAFLKANGLEPGKFMAFVPRLRLTPYHLIRKTHNYSQAEIDRRTSINEKNAESDHAKMREAIVAFVRKTGGKALLCPEMTYELDIMEPLLERPLPEDVKSKVVRRKTFWLPDEAASVYARAVAVVSFECHSPIIAAAVGTPCMYLHQPEDGIKGQMWKDVGLADWYFEIEQARGAEIAARVLEIAGKRAAARAKVAEAAEFARRKQAETMQTVRALALA
jgi:polysaccharide pyruvyl transferase WcaK-like protein